MKNLSTVLCLALAGAAIGLWVGQAAAQQFSADMVNTSNKDRPPGKIYVSGTKMRMEGQGRSEGALVVDNATGTAVVLVPAQKMYMDMAQSPGMDRTARIFRPADPNNACPQFQQAMQESRKSDGATWTCKKVGQETVNGRSTIKYEGDSSSGEHVYGWVDPQLKFLVKADEAKGGSMELQNIKEGPQPANLFEIPADYKKFDMQQMMQQMMQQRGAPPRQ